MTEPFISAEVMQNGLIVISGATAIGVISAVVRVSILWGKLSNEIERIKIDVNAAHTMRRLEEERLRIAENHITRLQHQLEDLRDA